MKICVFASGTGTNFKILIDSIKEGYLKSEIPLLISNNPDCNAVKTADHNGIDYRIISRKLSEATIESDNSGMFTEFLEAFKIDFIVLAGYTHYVPSEVIRKFVHKIINIHPALLPSFGGKGMYGIKVHKAVIESGVKVSGITIHFVNEVYDKGEIIFQKCVEVSSDDDEFSLQKKIQKLEHKFYPFIVKKFEEGKVKIENVRVTVN